MPLSTDWDVVVEPTRADWDQRRARLATAITTTVPGVAVRCVGLISVPYHDTKQIRPTEYEYPLSGIVRLGCDPAEQRWDASEYPCEPDVGGRPATQLVAVTPENATAIFGLCETELTALREGSVVVLTSRVCVIDEGGQVTLAKGRVRSIDNKVPRWILAPTLRPIPAVLADGRAFPPRAGITLAAVTPETADAYGLTVDETNLYVGIADNRAAGELAASGRTLETSEGLAEEQAMAVGRTVGAQYPVRVERGYNTTYPQVAALLAGMLAGAIPGVLFALMSTVERTRMTTLGGPERSTETLTNVAALRTGIVDVPWMIMLAMFVLVPLVAAVIGALVAGRPLDLTRRRN